MIFRHVFAGCFLALETFYRAHFGGQKTERASRNFYCGGRFQDIDWRFFMGKRFSKIQTVRVRIGSAL